MEKLEIKGGRKISGTVVISGSKNATLPILASTILTNKKVIIKNIPIVRDVETMAELLSTIGSAVKFDQKRKKIEIQKIAFITKALDLSSEEAQVFWPVYNNFSDESDTGPSMYYSTNNQSILEEHEFVLKVQHSQSLRSATINLGFMIVEGSEVVRLNGQTLLSGADYTIDYFTGTLNLINENALDPTANLEITYEENELLSFDQKLLTGLHFKYDYSDNDYFNGGLYYYNQSIVIAQELEDSMAIANSLMQLGARIAREIESKDASIIAGKILAVAVPDVVKTALGLREDLEIPNVKNPAVLSSIKLVQLKFLFSVNDNINGVFVFRSPATEQLQFNRRIF